MRKVSRLNQLIVYAFTIKLCLRSIFRLNLGDIVRIGDERYTLTQGVNDPYWHMHHVTTNKRLEYVHRDAFIKERSVRNVIHDIKSTWQFYEGYWFSTWFRDPSQRRSWP